MAPFKEISLRNTSNLINNEIWHFISLYEKNIANKIL